MSKLTVAGVELRSKYILAPLAGYTSYAMRKISNEYGVGMTYTEMISSSALVYDSKKTMSMLPKKKEETEEFTEENTLENDLFDLIDSMYDNREEE